MDFSGKEKTLAVTRADEEKSGFWKTESSQNKMQAFCISLFWASKIGCHYAKHKPG